jgi:hypothetical protein
MSDGSIEIDVGDVSNIEARVFVRFRSTTSEGQGGREPVSLRGTLRGPYCERAHTLPAEDTFRDLGSGVAEAVVPDPCLWSLELPHLYEADIEAVRAERLVAAYHGQIGLRLTPPSHERKMVEP